MGKEIKMNPGAPAQQQANINLNPDDLEDMVCEKCSNQTFVQVFLFKKLSAILSPSGRDTLVPLQTYECKSCSHMNSDFLPKDQ
tara:strand:- start:5 stop:256 length:252 start_codon:yes stop_codon:yes gene_type:complete